jgi:uncharacterized membrane protein (UPF0127 family)
VKLINQTKNTVIAEEVVIADNILKRMKGLLGKKEFSPGQALVLTPCNCIHTLFMNFPIDVLFVDKDNRVIKAIPSLKPFALSPICPKAAYVIELPSGVISSTSTHAGDYLKRF